MKKLVLVILALLLLAGCSSAPPTPAEKPQPKPPEELTGRAAFQQLYVAAHGWARDAQPFLLESVVTASGNGQDGKSEMWRANFASPSQRGTKPYTWAGTDAIEGISRGITPGTEDNYNPSNSSTQVFDIAYLKIDSDQALTTSLKHGGEKLIAQKPPLPVFYALEWNRNSNSLSWHVAYGASRSEPKLTIEIDASTGAFVRVQK
jgi:uncharacterized protein YceK